MNNQIEAIGPGAAEPKRANPARGNQAESMGVLGRVRAVRMVNCSPSGCLLESTTALDVGTIASVSLRIGGLDFADEVRVVRCQPIAGAGSLFHIGAQFLWTSAPGRQSLRLAMQMAGGAREE